MRSPRLRSIVHTEAPRPKSESLARAIASSSESTVITGTTGPKISSRMIRMSWRHAGEHGGGEPVGRLGTRRLDRAAAVQLGARPPRRRPRARAPASNCSRRDHRADLGVPVHRVADPQRLGAAPPAPSTKRLGHVAHHVHALDARAGLAGVGEAAPQGAGHGVAAGWRPASTSIGSLPPSSSTEPFIRSAHATPTPRPTSTEPGEEDLGRARLHQRLAHGAAAVHGAHEALGHARRARTPAGSAGRSAA